MKSKRIHYYNNCKPSLWAATCEQTVVKEVIFMSEVISRHKLNDIFMTIVLPLESSTKSYSEGSNHSAISTFGANPSQDSDLLMAESSMRTKRFTRSSEAKRDRISALPDEILSCILSFLPTKYAVGTSILSKRWKFLWTFTPNLIFDDSLLFSAVLPEEETPFLNFAERVVRCHSDLSRVRKFELRCFGAYSVSRICKLISAAASRTPNVEEIHLDFCTGQLLFGFGTEKLVELPQNIYASCERLQVLKLSGDIVMNVPPLVRFSSLKTLRLTLVHCGNDDSLEKLLAGCPILEDLYIQPLLTFSETVNVCSSSLRNLEIQNDIRPLRAVAQRGRFVLETPNLEQLKLRDHSEGDYKVKDVSSLVSANVDFKKPHKITSLLQLLKKISHVRELRLSNHTVDILEENRNDEIPFFHNLTHLKVVISKVSKSIVPRLLERSPNLASFKVEKVSAQPGEGSN